MLVGLLMLFWQSPAKEHEMLSSSGLKIVCSITGTGRTIDSSEYSHLNPIPGTSWIWSSEGIEENDNCNITAIVLIHSNNSDTTATISTPDGGNFYVNGMFCASISYGSMNVSSCFTRAGYHELTFRILHGTGMFGMAFKIVENYLCPSSCPDCMNMQCCPFNYIIDGSNCTCSSEDFASCYCPEQFELMRTSYDPLLYSCFFATSHNRSNIISSNSGMNMSCSISGSSVTTNSASDCYTWGGCFIWSSAPVAGDICNVTVTFFKHSALGRVSLLLSGHYSNANYNFFIGRNLLKTGYCMLCDITEAINYVGPYELTFQKPFYQSNSNSGMAFGVKEDYLCPLNCSDCINDRCCPSNYIVEDNDCGCSQTSLSSCRCPFGYELISPESQSSLSTCHLIDLNNTNKAFKHSIVKSKSGLTILCSITGVSTTANSPFYETYNDIFDADWIWTENGAEDNDYCNVTFIIIRHPLSTINLQIDGADTLYFYVNEVQCWWGSYEDASDVSISECFTNEGFQRVTFQSRHSHGSFGMAFKLVETYPCSEDCSYSIEDQCNVIHNMGCIGSMNNAATYSHLNQDLKMQDESITKANDYESIYSRIVIILASVIGTLAV